MKTVSKYVAKGHRGVEKAVNEDCLDFAFQKVHKDHVKSQSLGESGMRQAKIVN